MVFLLLLAAGWQGARAATAPDTDKTNAAETAANETAHPVAPNTPIAVITGWSFSSDPESTDIHNGTHLDLKADQSDIIFFFDAIPSSNIKFSPEIEFRYRLTSYDSEWTSTLSHMAHYRRLPPGRYQLEVQARPGGEAWTGEGWTSPVAKLSVYQLPHIYQTWYFYAVLGLVGVAWGVLLFRRRVQRMKGSIGIVLEERNRIARECHDTLMAGFAAISWQLEATSKLFVSSGQEGSPAAESCELARRMVAHCQAEARRIIWDLRDTDEVTNLLSQALARTLSANHVRENIETTLNVEGEEIPLAPGCVHHLVCIGQEAVSNAMRHANASRIGIQLKYEPDSLSLSIRDDGQGFHTSESAAARKGHFGIAVMEERARKLGGTLKMQTSASTGTEVMVSISFNAMEQQLAEKNDPQMTRGIGM